MQGPYMWLTWAERKYMSTDRPVRAWGHRNNSKNGLNGKVAQLARASD